MSTRGRLLALRLAALAEADREWLLERLAPADAGRLRALLGELAAAGLLTRADLLRDVLPALDASAERPAPPPLPAWLQDLAQPLPAGWRAVLQASPRPVEEARA